METRLKELRNACNLSLSQLSEDLFETASLKISPDSLSKYERGDRDPKLSVWIGLADFYSVSLDYLVGRDECV